MSQTRGGIPEENQDVKDWLAQASVQSGGVVPDNHPLKVQAGTLRASDLPPSSCTGHLPGLADDGPLITQKFALSFAGIHD